MTDGRQRAEPFAPPGLPRWVEVPVALLLLVASAPLLALAAPALLATQGRPLLFRQTRLGRGGRPFTFVKLRTLRAAAPGAPPVTAAGDPRMTPVGRVLRRLKIDELPALVHVLGGEMSFVGPRPEVPELADLGRPIWQAVLAVRPGLTDPVTLRLLDEEALLASAGADPQSFYERRLLPYKLRQYEIYLRHRSWRSDLAVLGRTALALVGVRGRLDPVRLDDLDT